MSITGNAQSSPRTATMRAAVWYEPGDIRLEARDRPQATPGSVVLKVEACAVCGSDMRIFRDGNDRIVGPRILGHEIAGIVVDVGAGVSKFRNGDRLSVGADIPCGKCEQCLAQRANCCETNLAMGYQFDGGFAEFVKLEAGVVEHGPVHAFGVDLPFGLAALAEPLACCINGYQRCLYESGGTVVVFGAGPMGAMLAMYGRYKGASQIITVEPSHSRRAWAKEFTSDEVIDPSHDDTVARIMDLTGGMGAEAIFTACASTTAHEQAIAVVARRGVVNLFGGLPKSAPPIALASNHIHYREAYLTGSHGSTPQQHEMALRMIESGEFDVSKLISEELPLEELPRFVSEGPTDGVIKAIVRP